MIKKDSVHRISVIVPKNPFISTELQTRKMCLCALDVEQLMDWWPGTPHSPNRDPNKVKAIQRSLDWKRVAQIAAYLLQEEIVGVPDKLFKYFTSIYEPKKSDPGREWPPRVSEFIAPVRSEFPTFSNVLIHVNGARIESVDNKIVNDNTNEEDAAKLVFDANDKKLNFSVIDGQHRINGAYLAIKILKEKKPNESWKIPAEVFLDVDISGEPPRKQAQIFIDINLNQKKVDRSLVADLYPTTRGDREALDNKERAQDIGRKLMLEIGPLVGMIQIPGINYGVKDVIALATLNNAIEDIIPHLERCGLDALESQTEFLVQCLTSWFEASGRFEYLDSKHRELDPENVAYQGRILVSILALMPAMIWKLKNTKLSLISGDAQEVLTKWLKIVADNAKLLKHGVFIGKKEFKERKYLGSGGIGLFRDTLWASIFNKMRVKKPEQIKLMAETVRSRIFRDLGV